MIEIKKKECLKKKKSSGPVMEEDLAPGLAWMVMATDEGGTERMDDGNLESFLED